MFLNVDVRQFRAKRAKLPEIASHPCSKNIVMQMRKGNCEKGYCSLAIGHWAFGHTEHGAMLCLNDRKQYLPNAQLPNPQRNLY